MIKPKKLKKSKTTVELSEKIADAIVTGIQEKKGKEIVVLDLRNLKNSFTDFFVVCHADSKPHIEAIARSVEETVYKMLKEDPLHKEGFENAEWILLDYFNVIAHIFQREKRDFFGIERLWADAEISRIAGNF